MLHMAVQLQVVDAGIGRSASPNDVTTIYTPIASEPVWCHCIPAVHILHYQA